jgi:hypothetical protein
VTRLVVVPGPDVVTLAVDADGLPTEREAGTLYPPVLKSAARALAPAVVVTAALHMPLLDASAAVLPPSVQPGPVEIAAPLLDASAVALAPSVQPGTVTVEAPLLDAAAVALVPSVSAGPVALVAPLLSAPAVLLAPSVTVTVWTPADVSPWAWWSARDIAKLTQGSDGTTPLTADSQPVGRITDKSTNARYWRQSSSAAKPLYRSTSSPNWLSFDGVDDALFTDVLTFPSGLSVYAVLQPGDDVWMAGNDPNSLSRFFGVAQASAASPHAGAGSPTYAVNGVAVTATRQALLDAMPVGSKKILEVRGLDLSTWVQLQFGQYNAAGFPFAGRLHDYIVVPDLGSTDRTRMVQYLATENGVTL